MSSKAEELFWDVYAGLYDDLSGLLPYRQEMMEIAEALEPVLQPGKYLLDAACGTGYMLDLLSQKKPATNYVGIDRSPAMLKAARKHMEGAVCIELRHADLDRALPFTEYSFDVVTSVNTLYALEDPDAFLAELSRVMKPGGTLLVVNPWKPKILPMWQEHFRLLGEYRDPAEKWRTARLLPTFAAITAVNLIIARRAKGKVYHFLEPGELAHLVQANGFVIEKLRYEIYAGTCCMITAKKK